MNGLSCFPSSPIEFPCPQKSCRAKFSPPSLSLCLLHHPTSIQPPSQPTHLQLQSIHSLEQEPRVLLHTVTTTSIKQSIVISNPTLQLQLPFIKYFHKTSYLLPNSSALPTSVRCQQHSNKDVVYNNKRRQRRRHQHPQHGQNPPTSSTLHCCGRFSSRAAGSVSDHPRPVISKWA